jgi:hypothetical protein
MHRLLQVILLKENMYNSRKDACVSGSEVLVMFVKGDGEGTARNISKYLLLLSDFLEY